jgi:hypothetical protein
MAAPPGKVRVQFSFTEGDWALLAMVQADLDLDGPTQALRACLRRAALTPGVNGDATLAVLATSCRLRPGRKPGGPAAGLRFSQWLLPADAALIGDLYRRWDFRSLSEAVRFAVRVAARTPRGVT